MVQLEDWFDPQALVHPEVCDDSIEFVCMVQLEDWFGPQALVHPEFTHCKVMHLI